MSAGQNGGKRKGAGRPSKVTEKKVASFAIKAMKKVFGSEQKAWIALAKEAKESFPHKKLLYEYAYGKPKEIKEVDLNGVLRIVDDTDE